jgi:hypothetical protein
MPPAVNLAMQRADGHRDSFIQIKSAVTTAFSACDSSQRAQGTFSRTSRAWTR